MAAGTGVIASGRGMEATRIAWSKEANLAAGTIQRAVEVIAIEVELGVLATEVGTGVMTVGRAEMKEGGQFQRSSIDVWRIGRSLVLTSTGVPCEVAGGSCARRES
ncbi:hypothetical protein E2562_019721 [Oryza meyeriana var. granulata]|uniref:Uncharacterized protein n=1 Tax=Oryza meyeriana var. granulata TaxID=110450 RepID=A0A6G1C7P4_9ORYZ|nr:hypothetical protein E2562_019721 [Oryza meyeriana var. granulata]